MQSTATASAGPGVERMDLHELRDDLARSFAPANAHERMLVTQIAQSFLRLQKAQNAEAQYFEKKGVYEAITTDLNTYKAITRYTSDCERAWRHAVLMLERTQRRRIKAHRTSRIIAMPESAEWEPEAPAAAAGAPTCAETMPGTAGAEIPLSDRPNPGAHDAAQPLPVPAGSRGPMATQSAKLPVAGQPPRATGTHSR